MKIKLGLLKQLINEEAQKLDERYKVTRDDVRTLQKALNMFFVGDDVDDEDLPEPGTPEFDKYMTNMQNTMTKELKVDGIFGKNTRADLMGFQETAGLTQDGVAGPKTFRSLALELRDTSDGMPDEVKAAYEEEVDPIAAELDRLSGEKALMGRRRRKKKKPDAEKKPALGGRKADPEKGRSAEEKKDEVQSEARRALIQAEKLGAEVAGDRTGADGAPLLFIIDRPDSELEAGANSITADKLKDLMMKVFFGTSRMLDMKDIEVDIIDPKKVDAADRPAELKGKIRLTVTGPAREKGSGPLSDEEEAKLFEAREKLRVLREARRRK